MTINEVKQLDPETLREIIENVPSGRAKEKYQCLLREKLITPLRVVQWEEEPTFYTLRELLTLRHITPEELREVHKAKLAFPDQRIIQEGPEA